MLTDFCVRDSSLLFCLAFQFSCPSGMVFFVLGSGAPMSCAAGGVSGLNLRVEVACSAAASSSSILSFSWSIVTSSSSGSSDSLLSP